MANYRPVFVRQPENSVPRDNGQSGVLGTSFGMSGTKPALIESANATLSSGLEQGRRDEFHALAKFGENQAPVCAMTFCRGCKDNCRGNESKEFLIGGTLVTAGEYLDFHWTPEGHKTAGGISALAAMEFYASLFLRVPLVVIVWIQMFIQDGFMSMEGFVILFGAFLILEIIMWIFAFVARETAWGGSYLTAHLISTQMGFFVVQLFSFILLLNIYLSSRNKAGFDFEAAIPSGTAISTNNAWGQGTSILAIPTNVYVNDQITSMMTLWNVLYLVLIGHMMFVVVHGQHPYKNAMY